MIKIDLTPVVQRLYCGVETLGKAFHRAPCQKDNERIREDKALIIYQNNDKKKCQSNATQSSRVTNLATKMLDFFHMIPFIRIAVNWYRARQKRITDLQNQCIEKAKKEVMKKAQIEIMRLFWSTLKNIEDLKCSAIPDWEKQLHQDYSISINKKTAQSIRECAELDIIMAYAIYKENPCEKFLKEELLKSFVSPNLIPI